MADQGDMDKSLKRKRTSRIPKDNADGGSKRRKGGPEQVSASEDIHASVAQSSPAPPQQRFDAAVAGAEQAWINASAGKELAVAPQAVQSTVRPGKPKYKGWSLTTPIGGRYISRDPKFTSDGAFLLTAKAHELRILALEDSTVHKAVQSHPGSAITAFTASLLSPSVAYVAYDQPHSIVKVDWEGQAMSETVLTAPGAVTAIQVIRSSDDSECIVCLAENGQGSAILQDGKTIYTSDTRLTSLALYDEVVLATGVNKVVAVIRSAAEGYACKEWSVQLNITSVAIRSLVATSSKKKQKSSPDHLLSMALGTSTGEILVYEGVRLSAQPGTVGLPTPRTLHWHRQAVQSVKWSHDGSYLISGGRETVLVIWQLATGKKQFLPHLSADIEHITISHAGSSYAIQLADNSVMVLSTSELKPIAHFPDLQPQLPAVEVLEIRQPRCGSNGTVDTSQQQYRIAGQIHPIRRNELVLAVPPLASSLQSAVTARPFVQAYDTTSARHIYRQALTRSKITDLNTGPEGKPIAEPDVHLLRLSHDGSVMVTVESWTPNSSDYGFLAADSSTVDEYVQQNRESYLKFWRWNESKSCWALQTRITNPHPCGDSARPGHVFDIVSDPLAMRFYSVGEDHTVRTWVPRKSKIQDAPQDWVARAQHQLQSTTLTLGPAGSPTGSLAVSPDASLLAVHITPSGSAVSSISLLKTSLLSLACTLPPTAGHIHALALTTRHLYSLSTTTLSVTDLPTLRNISTLPLSQPKSSIPLSLRPRSLSVSPSGLAGITLPTTSSSGSPATRFEVHDPFRRHHNARYRTTLPGIVSGALAHTTGAVWTLIGADTACIWTVRAPRDDVRAAATAAGSFSLSASTSEGESAPLLLDDGDEDEDQRLRLLPGSDGLAGAPRPTAAMEQGMHDGEKEGMQLDGDKPVVRPEQLASMFDGLRYGAGAASVAAGSASSAAGGVRAMFDGVLGLFARRSVALA